MTNSLVYAILPLEDKRVVVRCQPVLLPERVGKTRREPVKKISLLCVLVIGALVLTTGTALSGRIITGEATLAASRAGEPPSIGLSNAIRAMGFAMGRNL